MDSRYGITILGVHSATDLSRGLDIIALIPSWRLTLQAASRSEATTYLYGRGVDLYLEYAKASGVPTAVAAVTAEHIRAWLVWLSKPSEDRMFPAAYAPKSIGNYYDGLSSLFSWAMREGEIATNPFDLLEKPSAPEEPPTLATEAEVRKLLGTMRGTSLEDRRDAAITRLFYATGIRWLELANLTWDPIRGTCPELAVDAHKGR